MVRISLRAAFRGYADLRLRGLALLAAALIVATACGSATPTRDPSASSEPTPRAQASATDGSAPTESSAASPAASPEGPASSTDPAATLPPVSETLIAKALDDATITYEQSLLYRALALFDSPGLPGEFRSPIPDVGGATALLGEIDQKEAELTPALLAKLAPYRARPADPTSIFSAAPSQASNGIVLAAATPPPVWVSQLVPGTNVRVWVKDGPFTQSQLERFAIIAAKVWEKLPGVFRYGIPDQPGEPNLTINPDGAIDAYFVEVGAIDHRDAACLANPANPDCAFSGSNGFAASATPYAGATSSAYVVINAGLADDQLHSTLAHELAHTGQFAYDRNESTWLKESTATWAAYRVMQKLGLLPVHEYERLSRTPFFKELDKSLAQPAVHSRQHVYASWLYFLFATMEAGDAIVTRVWERAAAAGVQSEEAINEVFPFDDHFADFALRNWNQDPVTPQYKDVVPAPFPGGLQPRIVNREPTVMTGDGDSRLLETVSSLASLYYVHEFGDAVRKVTFDNALAGVAHAHVWAIKKIGDSWAKPEDWTKNAKMEFCRDAAGQDLTELVLIFSYTGTESDGTGALSGYAPRVVAETKGCVGWVGEIRGQGSYSTVRGPTDWLETSVAQVHFVPNPWGAGMDPEFVLDSAAVTWTSQWIDPPTDMSKPGNPPPYCPTTLFSGSYEAAPYDKTTNHGDGGINFRPPPDAAPTPQPGATKYALREYEGRGLSDIPYIPCQQHGGVSMAWWDVPWDALATVSDDGRTLEGTWSAPSALGNTEIWTWRLQYIGPP
jgi:hypothetical protein